MDFEFKNLNLKKCQIDVQLLGGDVTLVEHSGKRLHNLNYFNAKDCTVASIICMLIRAVKKLRG